MKARALAWGLTGLAALGISACSSSSTTEGPSPGETAPAPSDAPAPGVHQVRGTAPRAPNNGVVIVTLTPTPPHELPVPLDTAPRMDQVNLTFVPSVLLVRTGQPVQFLNNDDVLHNVRVREEATREGAFNVAIPTGGSFTFTFPRDGFYIVGCDIHPGMAAAVFAASTPYMTIAETDATFTFPDVEPGSYMVSVFAGEDRFELPIEVSEPVTDVTITRSGTTSSND